MNVKKVNGLQGAPTTAPEISLIRVTDFLPFQGNNNFCILAAKGYRLQLTFSQYKSNAHNWKSSSCFILPHAYTHCTPSFFSCCVQTLFTLFSTILSDFLKPGQILPSQILGKNPSGKFE